MRLPKWLQIAVFPLAFASFAGGATTRTVDTLSDVTDLFDGVTTLREAVAASADGDVVDFAPGLAGKAIRLDQGEIVLNKSITISGGIFARPVIAAAKVDPERLFTVTFEVAPTFSRLVLAGGHAEDGGAIFSEGNVLLEGCRFEGNSAELAGGAVYHAQRSLIMRDCEFVDNSASSGGAVASVDNAFLSAERCDFEGNWSTGSSAQVAAGAGFWSRGSGADLRDCRFVGNIAPGDGVAIGANQGGNLVAVRCLFVGNRAGDAELPRASTVSIAGAASQFTNCAFTGNERIALKLQNHDVAALLTNCTLSGNGGAGISAFNQEVRLRNTIVWENERDAEGQPDSSLRLSGGAVLTASHSLLDGWDLTASGDGNLDGTDPANDPGFASLVDPADAPTEDGDFLPDLFGAVTNAGDASLVGGLTDAAGNPRVIGTEVDLGAYEVQRKVIHVDQGVIAADGDGFTWATAIPNLGDALALTGPGDVMFIAAGTYFPDVGEGRAKHDVTARFDIDHALELRGGFPSGGGERDAALNSTVVSGDLGDGFRSQVLFVVDPSEGAEVVFDGLKIIRADGGNGELIDRGGVSVNSGSIAFVDCIFRGNYGVVNSRDGIVSFRRCQIIDNGSAGSRLFSFFRSEVRYTNTRIVGNEGLVYHNSGMVTAINIELSGNDSSVELIGDAEGTFINGTVAGNDRIPFVLNGDSSASFINTIIWNNRVSDMLPQVWVRGDDPAEFSHCIVEGMDLTDVGTGNFDGTDPISNPAFIFAGRASDAPNEGGVYTLSSGTPARDAGDPTANSEPLDLAGRERAPFGEINIGAYEQIFAPFDEDEDQLPDWWEFYHSDPQEVGAFDPQGDDDGDGLINIAEFVHGLDPNVANVADDYLRMLVVEQDGAEHLALGVRIAPGIIGSDWGVEVQRSTDLGDQDPWSVAETSRFADAERQFERVYRSDFVYGTPMAEFLRAAIRPVQIIHF